ncbi:MAG: fatty acid oxidation complex subunit alpha FadJ [Candidatus Eremiobacterota bacterium]
MTTIEKAKAMNLIVTPEGVAVLTLDTPGRLNVLSPEVFQELNDTLEALKTRQGILALVIESAKKDNFIAGADIKFLVGITSADEGTAMSRAAQGVFGKLEELPFPSVVAVHGSCLGGGLELSLAASYRIISEDEKTQIGLPEVQIGLLPGAGGTQRLPRLVGLPAALDMILTGKRLRPRQARKIGLADEVVPVEILSQRARKAALELSQRHGMAHEIREGRQKTLTARVMEQFAARSILYAQVRADLRRKIGDHFPAPYKALEAAMASRKPLAEGLDIEARLFGELAAGLVSKNLIHIFNLTTALKADSGLERGKEAKPRTLRKIGVLGGGLMGSGIATVYADKLVPVRIKDRTDEVLGKSLSYAWKVFDRKVERRRLRPYDRDLRMSLISPTTDYSGFKRADLVIEAVFEDLALKQQVLKDVEEHCGPDTIFASNTSSIPIARIAEGAARPQNVIGMHFFSPVERMPLVEVIVHPGTSDEVTATTVEAAKLLGKHVIVVNDGVGFYTSRVLAPFINEAVRILFEGAAIDQIDQALKDFGFPVGPIVLQDEVGIDVATKVMKIMTEAFPTRFEAPKGWEKVIQDGRLGRKAQKGFYRYSGKSKEPDPTLYDLLEHGRKRIRKDVDEIQQRCVMSFLNEAALCLEENVLRSPRDGDAGAIFGLGFPPFLGGPFRYMDQLGLKRVVERLNILSGRFGPRFEPARILVEMAEKDQKFYP